MKNKDLVLEHIRKAILETYEQEMSSKWSDIRNKLIGIIEEIKEINND